MKVRLEVSDQEILYHIADVVKNKQRKLSTAECVVLDLANKLPSHATSQKGGWAVTDTWRALVREQFGARIKAPARRQQCQMPASSKAKSKPSPISPTLKRRRT